MSSTEIKASTTTTVNRIEQARAAADGPWREVLDLILAAIQQGADPHSVLDEVLGLMDEVRAEGTAAA
jgi:hypothetical protein